MNANASPIMITPTIGIFLMDLTIPVIWILKDSIQKNFGKTTTQRIIVINVAVNVFVYLWALLGNTTAPDALYNYMSGTALMFFFSMLAFYVSENIDAIVYARVKGKHVRKSLISNIISAPIDSTIAAVGLRLIGMEWHLIGISFTIGLIMKFTLPAIFYGIDKIRIQITNRQK